VDAYTAAVLGFEGGMIAQVSCGLGLQQENSARIYGDKGWLQVPAPFVLPFEGGVSQIFHYKAGSTAPERIDVSCPPLYTAEADAFAAAVFAGAKEVSAMTPGDSLGNMAVLEKWLAAAGVDYAKIGV
jgi:predicted dehydrogenase